MSDTNVAKKKKKSVAPPPKKKKKEKYKIPHREPTIIIPPRQVIFPSPDKTTCALCDCFPKEDPYLKRKKMNPCQHSPRSLFLLAIDVVETLKLPDAFQWSIEDVTDWIENTVGLPQYKECMIDNKVNGLRLLMFEDPSKLPMVNITDFQHIKRIVSVIRREYGMDFIRFARSIGLPWRRPFVNCTWFKSRTGPTWGIRQNWTICEILRQMKIIDPMPVDRDHWDLVWYMKPDFPKTLYARVGFTKKHELIPRYKPSLELPGREYLAPRKFRFLQNIPEEAQYIWMERTNHELRERERLKRKKPPKREIKFIIKPESKLVREKIVLDGLAGKDLILARRLRPKEKFIKV